MPNEEIQQNYADATGFVVDRSATPPKIVGQAFLVSKSRAVTCASVVANYVEAPWAIEVRFPHPDILLGVKSIALHNDFDKRAARTWYLGQTGVYGEQLCQGNDMASLVLDAQLSELQPEQVAELNRALTLPFQNEGVEASGSLAGSDLLQVINGILQSRRDGLLTLFDARNIPCGRVLLTQGRVQKVYFRGIVGELAFFELIYRKPGTGYAFQAQSDFSWGEVRDIIAPTDALVEESKRRCNEIPQMFAYLGGPDARYQPRVESIDPSNLSEEVRWLGERLFMEIDGYMTADRLSERLFVDTYTVLQCLREFINKGLVSMINRATPFHCGGTLGTPLVSHTDFEVHAWDPVQSFYLDPLSGKPAWMQGNFFGVANALQPKNMLHTIAMPPHTSGALILKDFKLIGVHSGPQVLKPGQPLPPVKCYQMMWMGALLDMTTKKLRSAEEAKGLSAASYMALKASQEDKPEGAAATPDGLQKLICPSCYSTNSAAGPCFNCGTIIEPPAPEVEPQGKLAQSKVGKQILQVQKKYNLSNKQMAMAGCAVVALPLIMMMGMCQPQSAAPPPPTPEAEVHRCSDETIKTAVEGAGFAGTAIPGYYFVDTAKDTVPVKSFGMQSDQSNNKALFLVMDDMSAVNNIEQFVKKPLNQDDVVPVEETDKADRHSTLLGTEKLQTVVQGYGLKNDDKHGVKIVTSAFPSPLPGKSVLVISRAKDNTKNYDPRGTEFLIDQMEVEFKNRASKVSQEIPKSNVGGEIKDNAGTIKMTTTGSGTGSSTGTTTSESESKFTSDEDIDKYCDVVSEAVEKKMKLPDDAQDLADKKKFKKLKASMLVGINNAGEVRKLQIVKQPELDSMTEAFQKAINSSSPFENAPQTKDDMLMLKVSFDGEHVKVTRQ
ncbi:MAG TPA: hypothetical protein V6C97_07140 [Oculatellaceae cyanobacterium]